MPIKTLSGSIFPAKKLIKSVSLVLSIAIAVSSYTTVRAYSDTEKVMITDGNKSVTVTTESKDPRKIVAEAGFVLDANDELDTENFSEKGGTININRAKLVRIDDNGQISYIIAYDDTVADVVKQSDISLSSGDEINCDLDSDIFDGMLLSVNRAYTVTIICDGESRNVSMTSGTVGDAVEKAGIVLGENDMVSPSLDTLLIGSEQIVIKRVSYKIRTEKETVPFEKKVKLDPDMTVDQTEVTTKGVEGEKEITYVDLYVDGVLSQSEVSSEEIITEPVNEVLKVGTKRIDNLKAYEGNGAAISELEAPDSLVIGENGEPENYKECITGKATAYTGDPTTAVGIEPKPGYIAVDPEEIPYGTELYVVSADGTYVYGYCIAADTGGFVEMGNTDIDLYMNTEEMCDDWGNRAVKIYVL